MKTNGTLGLRSLWSAATLFLAAPGALFPAGYVNFNLPKAYAVGSQPNSEAVGDFNGDGKLDLAVANGGDNTVSILLGNGNGVFRNRSEEHTSELQSLRHLVCRLLLEKKKQ